MSQIKMMENSSFFYCHLYFYPDCSAKAQKAKAHQTCILPWQSSREMHF
ncbi:hypothetical protein SLEP1_g19657 [Rubroshorea leprosula]|uniref:Uncharacterized protein n=1 Tax=Rubroshorea leprosula TaxID=152421 RepID=A0AAV5J928_9ROSI|nr:hypothetical protein SLEP1_g19657 [Rubroshorea leprosula]